MQELDNFYNAGFGWICRSCERETEVKDTGDSSRLMSEGEAESKQPRMSNTALAKWFDKIRTTLICPQCGVVEVVDKS